MIKLRDGNPKNMSARVLELLPPVGKGQRAGCSAGGRGKRGAVRTHLTPFRAEPPGPRCVAAL